MKKLQFYTKFIKENRYYMMASFFIPFFIMVIIYLSIGIYLGSARSVLASDAFSQTSNFYSSFNNVLHGKQSIFYTWNASIGLNYLSLVSYYLGGLFTPLVFFFPNQQMPEAIYFLTLLKIGSAGLSFWFLAKHTFNIPKIVHIILSVSYALMSFITAHSELIMWLDTFIYLPLIIWGIHRLMDERKPVLLFVSYLLLFITNFYMAFIVGIFSFLYFFIRTGTNIKRYKHQIIPYFITSILATGASMIIILPTFLDLKTNGETLTKIIGWKTEATSFWDIVMKNMIGVYDTTKYGSIPFIYVGLLPLIFCLFYFVTKRVPLKNKLLFGSLFILLIASFYLTPLNLFWHGLHAPNMFLFRYSFLYSFLIVLLAGYGWEEFKQEEVSLFGGMILLLIALFVIAEGTKNHGSYRYISLTTFVITITFLFLYFFVLTFYQLKKISIRHLVIFLLILTSGEALINSREMILGILDDWNYAAKNAYTDPYPSINKLVEQTRKDNTNFYRLENLSPVSSNDSINYGYSGISLFSSIRNRHSSAYLNRLGFRSRGTNLNIRYPNNTLLMDAFMGMKYNLSDQDPMKYGYEYSNRQGKYSLYENNYALPLGMITDHSIYQIKQPENNNLMSQTLLFNALSKQNQQYFHFYEPSVTSAKNVKTIRSLGQVTYEETQGNVAKEITWTITVPGNTQAYLSLFPTDFAQLDSSSVTVYANGSNMKSQIDVTGQYYNLGYYDKDTTISFTASFYGSKSVSFMEPKVLGLDTQAFEQSVKAIQKNGIAFKTGKRSAEGEVDVDKNKVLLTTIPYDKGWKAYIDNKQITIKPFQKAFISLPITKGKHSIKLVYLPEGFLPGVILSIVCVGIFAIYTWFIYSSKYQSIMLKNFKKTRIK